jgi:hypothetical protein
MILERRTRGQPLLVLGMVLTCWVGARAFAWEHALNRASAEVARAEGTAMHLALHIQDRSRVALPRPIRQGAVSARQREAQFAVLRAPLWAAPAPLPLPVPLSSQEQLAPLAPSSALAAQVPAPAPAPAPMDASRRIMVAGGHQSLWLAATALMALPPQGLGNPGPERGLAPAPAPLGSVVPVRRWSADSWLLLRKSGNAIVAGPNPGTYGASQVGAVIRYRLDPGDSHRANIYGRAYGALNGTREQQAALGLSARPIAALPLAAMGEARIVRDGAGVRIRPAAAVVTELPPQALPFGFAGEAYVQAGWVGGRQPTAFVDGLVRAERPLSGTAGGFSLRAGGGAWGASQRGAARVDVGPVASVTVRLTDTASARMEADWRFRVAGRSRPDSGPALTISAGF